MRNSPSDAWKLTHTGLDATTSLATLFKIKGKQRE
jgi:hypothetical protein